MSHSSEHSGLQEHSVGDDYPYSIVVFKGAKGIGYCQATNLITGEKLCPHWFGPNDDTFIAAHRKAESDIPRSAGDYVDGMRDLAELGYPEEFDIEGYGTGKDCDGCIIREAPVDNDGHQ